MSNTAQAAPEQRKPNASQRLDTLELNMQEVSMYLNQMARDIATIKNAIKLLGNKVDAIQKASNITDEVVTELMIDNNVAELKEKVDNFVQQGLLVATDLVTENSFVVGQEVDDAGKVVNKRVQFAAGALKPDLRDKLVGNIPGDKVTFSEGTLKFQIDEIYTIVDPSAKQAEAQAAEAQAAEAQDSGSPEQTTTPQVADESATQDSAQA